MTSLPSVAVSPERDSNVPPCMEIERSRMPALRRLIDRVLPRHAYATLRFELRLAWVRLGHRRVRRAYRGANQLLVNIAAGGRGLPGWINVDVGPWPNVNCVYDCRRSLPFPDDSVRGIFCEHFVEHLDYYEEAPLFLRECFRTLQPGGSIRIVVPNIERYLLAYAQGGWSELQSIRPLDAHHVDYYTGTRYRTRAELINHVFRQGIEHKFAYDFETLGMQLRDAGFTGVRQAEFGASILPALAIDQPERASESLYVEAVKQQS